MTAAELEAEISRRATEFDPVALTEVLLQAGYRPEEILYQSQHGHASSGSLVQAVEFRATPLRHVVVTLAYGLLGPNSPLPSYFKQLLASNEVDEGAFLEFIRFFDHTALERFVRSVAPERDPSVFADFDQVKTSHLRLVGLRSTSALHWLFQLVFPELGVRADRSTLTRVVPLDGVRLNISQLGSPAVLGGRTRVPVPGFAVTLYCDDEHDDLGVPWLEEARRRLDDVALPALATVGIDLRVSVVFRSEKVWARLSHESYLGFDRIRGGQRRYREVVVWSGQVTAGARCARRGAPARARAAEAKA